MWMSLGGQFLKSRAVSVSLHPGVQQHLGVSRGIPFFTGGAGWNLEDSKLRQQQLFMTFHDYIYYHHKHVSNMY